MFTCGVCKARESHRDLVGEVYCVDGRYMLVGGVPSKVCKRCGERSFSRETTEKVRRLVHGEAKEAKSVPMQVYEFAQKFDTALAAELSLWQLREPQRKLPRRFPTPAPPAVAA